MTFLGGGGIPFLEKGTNFFLGGRGLSFLLRRNNTRFNLVPRAMPVCGLGLALALGKRNRSA